MLFNFYYKTIKPVSMDLFYVLIGLLIAILVVNNKLNDNVNKNDDKNFKENLKAQKALIWTNFSIIILFFLYLLIISLFFFTPRFQEIYNRRRGILVTNILLFCLVALSTGLTYYINKTIDEMNLSNAKEELKKIYIIVPLISIIAICLLMYNFSKTDSTLTYMNHYLNYHQFQDIEPVTRNSSPTRFSPSRSENDVPEHFRENLPNRYSPYYYMDLYEDN